MSIAITGSTGSLGGRVAAALAAAGVNQRLLVRDVARAPALAGASAVACTYGDRAATLAALEGIDVLFMVSAAESADREQQQLAFVDAAAEAGVGHVVYTSFFGAAPTATFTLARTHWATEQRLRDSGLAFTFLRDNFYLDFLPDLIGEDGVIRGPAGEGRVAAVARADIARSAVTVLGDPAAHAGATYDLTGPEALTLAEVAAVVAHHRGQPVRFHDETVPEAYRSRARWGAPDWQVDAWVSTYTAIAAGELDGVTDHVRQLSGRAPVSLAAFMATGGE